MQGWRWVFSELRPLGNMSGLWVLRRKNWRHRPLNATPNTLDIKGHLTPYWFLRIEVDNVVQCGAQEGNP